MFASQRPRSVSSPPRHLDQIIYIDYFREDEGEVSRAHRYEDAAIYMKEGELLYDFAFHPKTKLERNAFWSAHNRAVLCTDLIASVVLLLLAIFEVPTFEVFERSSVIRGIAFIEIFCLLLCSVNVVFIRRWKGWRGLFGPLYIFAFIVWWELFIEALVVLGRGKSHFRITRCFRPIFFILSPLAVKVKAVFRDLLRSLKPIGRMMALLVIFILVFSVFGFYWFGLCHQEELGKYVQQTENWYFYTFGDTVVNLFILLTTANFPDIAMPAVKENTWAFLFFVIYLLLGVYFFASVILAAASEKFGYNEKLDAKKKYMHSREGLRRAFERLDINKTGIIDYNTFQGVMMRWDNRCSPRHILLCFKALDVEGHRRIRIHEWYEIYNILACSWRLKKSRHCGLFSSPSFPPSLQRFGRRVRVFSRRKWFSAFIYGIIVLDAILQISSTAIISKSRANCSKEDNDPSLAYLEGFINFCLGVYILEAIIKIIGQGSHYFTIFWNVFDFLVALVCIISFGLPGVVTVSTVRSFRFVKLFTISDSFRDTTATMVHLAPKMLRFLVAVLCVFYVFAVLGMEVFAGKVSLCGCTAISHNSTVVLENGTLVIQPVSPLSYGCSDEQFLRSSPGKGSVPTVLFPNASGGLSVCRQKSAEECLDSGGVDCDCRVVECGKAYSAYYDRTSPDGLYHLNNFDHIGSAYVVLFELMVVNNWHVLMQGTTDAVGNEAARVYFFVFYIATAIILTNVVVAFIVAAFNSIFPMFRGHRKLKLEKSSGGETTVVRRGRGVYYKIPVTKGELKLAKSIKKANVRFSYDAALQKTTGKTKVFVGKRRIEAVDVIHVLYETEIDSWKKEEEERCKKNVVEADWSVPRPSLTEVDEIGDERRSRAQFLWRKVRSKLGSKELTLSWNENPSMPIHKRQREPTPCWAETTEETAI